jgi:integrase
MAKIDCGEKWEQGFRAAVRASKPGWTITKAKGKICLRFRPIGGNGRSQSVLLPLEWSKTNTDKAILLINRIAKGVISGQHDSLKAALEEGLAESSTMRVGTDWPKVAASLKLVLTTGGNQILETTWRDNYEPYIDAGIRLINQNKSVIDGYTLVQQALMRWEGKTGSREACCIALRKLTDHAITRHKAATCWRIEPSTIKELRGRRAPRRTKATLTDHEIIDFIEAIEKRNPRWANALRLLALYGLRPIELQHLVAKRRADGSPGLWCKYKKSCGGPRTHERWLEPCPLRRQNGELIEWQLAERIGRGELQLPVGNDGDKRKLNGHYVEQFLSKQKEWQELRDGFEQKGEWLRSYSFRDSYSLRCHRLGIELGAIASAMGHSIAVHSNSYRWSSTATTSEAFAKAHQAIL